MSDQQQWLLLLEKLRASGIDVQVGDTTPSALMKVLDAYLDMQERIRVIEELLALR